MFFPYFNYMYKKKIYDAQNDIEAPFNIQGKWDSNFGEMILIQKGNQVTGYYYWKDGLITGNMYENRLEADWIEEAHLPPRDYGKTIMEFTHTSFNGKYGYREEPLYYAWHGKKISTIIKDNCNRYRVINKVDTLDSITINNEEKLTYEQISKYIYPEKCEEDVDVVITINDNTINKKVKVKPGFSYLLSIEGAIDNIIINPIIENPFYK